MIAVIDSGVGNIRSVSNALAYIGAKFTVTQKKEDLKKASKIIFPGVGSFADGMKALQDSNLLSSLEDEVFKKKTPYLGICLGMQLLAEEGQEDGRHKGLGWIKGVVQKIDVGDSRWKLPHIGWNDICPKENHLLYQGITNDRNFYFLHSYVLAPKDNSIVTATCEYGISFCASIQIDNIYGVQFHPEKSQKNGLQLLTNFVKINGNN